MTTKERHHQIIEALGDQEAADLLDYVSWLLEDEETVSADDLARVEQGLDEIRQGEYVTLDALTRELGRRPTRYGSAGLRRSTSND